MTSADKIAIVGIVVGALFSIASFLLTLYFVVFKMGRWMGSIEEWKKHVTQDIKTLRDRAFGGDTMWRPRTELAEIAERRGAAKKH